MGCSSLSIPKFNGSAVEVWEWVINSSHTSLGMWFLIMLGLKLIHVSKRGPSSIDVWQRNPWKICSRYRFSFRDHGRPWSVILLRETICLLIMLYSPLNKNYCGQYDYLIYHYIYISNSVFIHSYIYMYIYANNPKWVITTSEIHRTKYYIGR